MRKKNKVGMVIFCDAQMVLQKNLLLVYIGVGFVFKICFLLRIKKFKYCVDVTTGKNYEKKYFKPFFHSVQK